MTEPTKENLPTPSDLADALESADWSGVSIGNKILLEAAIVHLRLAANLPSAEEIHNLMAETISEDQPLFKTAARILERIRIVK